MTWGQLIHHFIQKPESLRLCDELESLLERSRTLGEQLLEATIRQLLAA